MSNHSKGERALSREPSPKATEMLPAALRREHFLTFDTEEHDIYGAAASLLQRMGLKLGRFSAGAGAPKLEHFRPEMDIFRSFKARQTLYQAVERDGPFLHAYEQLVKCVVLPHLKALLDQHDEEKLEQRSDECRRNVESGTLFFYQFPPSMRLQPGPSQHYNRVHRDAEYGHQPGEVNFWMPLTSYSLTRSTLWVESSPGASDYHPLDISYGSIAAFHGTLCRHYAPP